MSFMSLGLHADLLRGTEALGFAEPTSIQKDSIPPALQGRDVLACSMTGSGKTAAFGLPILQRIMALPRGATRALILTPTRELAAQIGEHLNELAKFTHIRSATVYGGVGMGPQTQAFKRGIDVIVATPGRLLDHMRSSYARLPQVEIVVLDEADRMLDMGFLPDIKRILSHLPARKQTLLFSATLPGPIKALSREFLTTPATVNVERKAAPATGLTQAVYAVPQHLKSSLLVALVRERKVRSVLAFTRTKHRADRLAQFLERQGIASARIHGDRTQAQRQQALDGFKKGRFRVLVATDVAARGIDVDELELVVNVDMPREPEDYIHRVGRTARAKATGDAFTFVAPDEEGGLRAIERAINLKLPRQKVEGFDYHQPSPERSGPPAHGRPGQHRGHRAPHASHQAARPHAASRGRTYGHGAPHAAKAYGTQGHAARPAHVRDVPRHERIAQEQNEFVELHERNREQEQAPVAGETRPWVRPQERDAGARAGHVPFWKRRGNKPQRRTRTPHAVNG